MRKKNKSKKSKPTKKTSKLNPDTPDVIDFTAADVVADLAESMAERGFHPCAMAFKNEAGAVEIYTHGIDVETFVQYLNEKWLPEAEYHWRMKARRRHAARHGGSGRYFRVHESARSIAMYGAVILFAILVGLFLVR